MREINTLITVASGFDPRDLWKKFAVAAEQRSKSEWLVTFASPSHGLAAVTRTSPKEIPNVTGHNHPIDEYGWADWSESGPGETEMTGHLLPSASANQTATVFRYDDAWVWDPTAPAVSESILADLGLSELSEIPRSLVAGKGAWAWKAIKIGWKGFGHLTRAISAFELTRWGWNKQQEAMVSHRAQMEIREANQRAILQLTEIRRDRLEKGSPESRKKARQYYTTLDALIAANS